MINTVNGKIDYKDLGITLIHEHIICDFVGADFIDKDKYNKDEILKVMVPYLKKLKESGCDTLVDSTPVGEGRAVEILRECSINSGINIITNTGAFYGNGVLKEIREKDIDEIVTIWTNEFYKGIEGTDIKPGFMKIALDDGKISPLQEKILRAAIRTSKITNLTIQCHAIYSSTILEAVTILEEENLELSKFIWAHADSEEDISTMISLGGKGMWIEIDSIGSKPYENHIELLNKLLNKGILDRLLISQDSGWYNIGQENGGHIKPYHKILTEFIPLWLSKGISKSVVETLLIDNPRKCLSVNNKVL